MDARKRRTNIVQKREVDVVVDHFSCHDSSVLQALNKHSKESRWTIKVGENMATIELVLHVDKAPMCQAEVKITCQEGSQNSILFPPDNAGKKKLKEDFHYRWPFRGLVKGINERHLYELKMDWNRSDIGSWCPAKITSQRADGRFEVLAYVQDGMMGEREMFFPAAAPSDLRDIRTRKPVVVPERILELQVPQSDPLRDSILGVDGEFITHFFGRPSPPPELASHVKTNVNFQVSKDRSEVKGDVGHSALVQYLTADVQSCKWEPGRLHTIWKIGIGPWAEHTIEVSKTSPVSRIVTLTIDGHAMVVSSAEDLDCDSEIWRCEWAFNYTTSMHFNVYETNRDGKVLDSQGTVTQKKRGNHRCTVIVEDDRDLTKATLLVNDIKFQALSPKPVAPHPESLLRLDAEALKLVYQLPVPYKVNMEAPVWDVEAASVKALQAVTSGGLCSSGGLFGFLNCCSRGVADAAASEDRFGAPRPQQYPGP